MPSSTNTVTAAPSKTLAIAQRVRLLEKYRGRGRRTNSLFLVYSLKQQRDWIVASNRRFVHWLAVLESNPKIKNFELAADGDELIATRVVVAYCDGNTEVHVVISGNLGIEDRSILRLNVEKEHGGKPIVIYTDNELKPMVGFALRWCKAVAYGAVLRGRSNVPVRNALLPFLEEVREGTISNVLAKFPQWNESLLIGMLVLLCAEGVIYIDLAKYGLGGWTDWLYVGNRSVESTKSYR
jgi:hypothetical protein